MILSVLISTLTEPYVVHAVTTRVDPLSFDELYGHLLAHEMRIEQQFPALELSQPSAHYTTRAAILRG
jgi:hypothetical protein